MPMNERIERLQAVRAAEGSLRLEGLEPSEADQALARRWAAGEISMEELLATGDLQPSPYLKAADEAHAEA